MRLIDADKFKENILSGLYVFCQENKEDIARAIDDEPTINELPEKYIIKVKTKADAQKIKNVWDKNNYGNPIIVSENFDITPIRPQGKWHMVRGEYVRDNIYKYALECSNCKHVFAQYTYYCPYCGSKMEGVIKNA